MTYQAYDLSALRILLVEDSKNMVVLLMEALRMLRIRSDNVHVSTDGIAALQDLNHFSPDLIVCDWLMEPLDGIELCKLLRVSADSKFPYVPIVMLTANTRLHQVCEARDAGVSEFLCKPISAASLYSKFCAVIEYPRQFIKCKSYTGPDRRRREWPTKKKRRESDERINES